MFLFTDDHTVLFVNLHFARNVRCLELAMVWLQAR